MFQLACRFCALFLALLGGRLMAQTMTAPTESGMLDEIRDNADQLKRIHLLSRFVDQFPDSKSLGWALRTLQAEYANVNYLRSSLFFGERLLDLYPSDFQAAEGCLKVAVKLGDSRLIRKYSIETWRRAQRAGSRESMDYAESMLAQLASRDESAADRSAAIGSLARLNRQSRYLVDLYDTADRIANPAATRTLPLRTPDFSVDWNDPDALVEEAERLTRLGTRYSRVFEYSQRAIQLMSGDLEPPPGEERSKRDRYRTAAYWMSGMAATLLGQYFVADRDLRIALPQLQGNPQALSITLYSLGYVNFQLAEEGQRKRIFDALKFNAECAAIPGAYREQARKNIDAIKMFYNMQ